jgi:AcrR family transcriptional regulator
MSKAATRPGVNPNRSGATTRAKVLKAALTAIAEVGPDRVRVQDVADRAGISTGHVMYYFGNRDRILIDTLLLSETDLTEALTRRVQSASGPREAVEKLVRIYLPSGPTDVRWKLWAQLIARPPTDPETLTQFATVIDTWAQTLTTLLASAADDGALTCADPADTAYRTCRLMDGYSLEVLLGAAGRSRAWAVRSVLSALGREVGVTHWQPAAGAATKAQPQ